MGETQMKILNMVSEGRISVEEARMLLESIGADDVESGPIEVSEPEVVSEGVVVQTKNATAPVAEAVAAGSAATIVNESQPVITNQKSTENTLEHLKDWVQNLVGRLGAKEKYSEDLEWTYSAIGVVGLEALTTNGSVKVSGTASDQIVIQARKEVKAPTEAEARTFAEQVEVIVVQEGDKLRVYKDHPKPPAGIGVTVSYQISCPSSIDLHVNTTSGGVKVDEISGDIQVESTNGGLDLSQVAGALTLKTTNGGIKAELTSLEAASRFTTTNGSVRLIVQEGLAPITASTSNGAIRLVLPPDFGGQLEAKTINGRVKSDFETQSRSQSSRHFVGEFGGGGDTLVKLQTTNGAIRLAQLGADDE